MATSRLAFAVVGIACVAAAGGGSYIATRQNLGQVAVPAAVASAPLAPAVTPEAVAPIAPPPAATASATVEPPAAPPVIRREAEPIAPPSRRPSTSSPASRRAARPPAAVATRAEAAPAPPMPTPEPAQFPTAAPPAAPAVEAPPVEVVRSPEPPVRVEQEVVVAADSVIGLRTEGLITSDRARVEDRVEARVVRDVRVNGLVAIPAGTRALGTVVVVERGGKVRERARLGIRFDTLVMADGTHMAIATEPIFRLGESPANGSRAKIGGGAVAGAILGAIIAGGKGAAIGATTGAGAGTAAVMAGERSAAIFPPGAEVTARVLAPVAVSIEKHDE